MAPSRHSPLLLGSMIAAVILFPPPNPCAAESGIVLKPGAVWLERDEAPPHDLRYDSAYLFLRSNPAGVRLPLPRSGVGWTLALSPRGGLVAYDLNHWGQPGIGPDLVSKYEVAVADTSGQDVISFAGGVRLAWSPDGRLAVAIACPPGPIPAFDSILVWEPDSGVVMARRVPQARGTIGWAGTDTVLIGPSMIGYSSALSCRSGVVGPNNHSGADVSPDGLYSICAASGWPSLSVCDDRTRSAFATSILHLLGMTMPETVGPACWVRYKDSGHTLAVTVCSPWIGGAPSLRRRECRTGLVDVGTRRLIGWTDGRLVGPTADSREAVVARGGALGFLGDTDWNQSPLPEDPTESRPRTADRPVKKRSQRGRGIQFAFTMQQLWCCDNGRVAVALGYESGNVYALRAGPRAQVLLSRPFDYWPTEASLNRSADLVAVAAILHDPPGDSSSVFVADTSGSIVARFRTSASFRWSADGNYLAVSGKELLVWHRYKGVVGTFPFHPDDYDWTDPATLTLRTKDRVIRLDWQSGDTTSTTHQAVSVSPDGAYSVDAIHYWAGPRLFDDRMHAEITKCSWGGVHEICWGLSGDPFWIRQAGMPHQLCISKCDARHPWLGENKVLGCEVAVIDVETMEQERVIPGKLIGRTADNRSVVVLRGDSLDVVPLDLRVSVSPGGKTPAVHARGKGRASLRAVVEEWGKYKTDTVGVHTIEVREGDWLPEWSGFVLRCGRGMRVRRVISPNRVEIEYSSGTFSIQPASSAPREGLALVTSGATTTLVTRSADGGRSIRLQIDR